MPRITDLGFSKSMEVAEKTATALGLQDLGLSRFHRAEVVNIDTEIVQTEQQFPDDGFPGDKVANLTVSKLTTGTIKSQQITLGVTADEGDVYIAAGTVDTNAWTATGGFILGLDDSAGGAAKFYIGDGTTSMDWNVTATDTLTIKGTITATGGSIGGFNIGIVA